MARRRRGEPESIEALISEGTEFIRRFESGDAHHGDAALAAGGVALANRLRSGAIGLTYDKATEFSPAIPRLHLLAVQVALLAFGSEGSSAIDLALFEKDVFYYGSFTPEHPIVAEYREFKARHGPR